RVQRRPGLREPSPGRAQLHRRRAGGAALRSPARSGRAAERARDPPRGGGGDAGDAGGLAPELPRAGTAPRPARRHDRPERRDRAPAARARVPGMKRIGLVLAGALLALGTVFWRTRARREFVLPAGLRVEQTVRDLTGVLDPGAVVAQRPETPVRIRGIRPGRNTNPNAGYRTALIAPAPTLLRYRVAVPERASLRFGAGVEPPDRIDPAARGVRFTV